MSNLNSKDKETLNKYDLVSIIKHCKIVFEQIKNNSECENYVFKKAFRAICDIEKWTGDELK